MKLNPSLSRRLPRVTLPLPKHSVFVQTLLVSAALPFLAGCVDREVVYRDRPVYVQAPPPGSPVPPEVVVSGEPPMPPPQVEYISAAPDPSFIWIGGSWEWRGRWVWSGGRWDHRPHAGAEWGHGHWDNRGHGRVWIGAGWH